MIYRVALQAILLLSSFDFSRSRSLLRATSHSENERQLETSSCPFPVFDDADWEQTVKYPVDIAESHGKFVGSDFVLLSGFYQGFHNTTQEVYALNVANYDPKNKPVWRRMDDYPVWPAINHAAVVVIGTKIYMLGGYVGAEPGGETSAVYIYDHSIAPGTTGQWSSAPALPDNGRAGAAAFYDSLTSAVYFVSGARRLRASEGIIDATDYDDAWRLPLNSDGLPLDDSGNPTAWESVTKIPYKSNHVSYETGFDENGNERHFVFGGQVGQNEKEGNFATVMEYLPEIDGPGSWVAVSDMPAARGHTSSSTFAWGCGIITAGGATNGDLQTDEVLYYDIPTDKWHIIGHIVMKVNTPICGFYDGWMHCELPFGWPTHRRRILEGTPPPEGPTSAPTPSPTPSPTISAAPTPVPPAFELRINSGSNSDGVDSNGNTWIADTYFTYGWTPSTDGTVKNALPQDQFIYRSGRHTGGLGLFYEIPVPNGNYQVNLHYNEFWHSNRVFDLQVEDKFFNDLSLVNLAGGTMTAYIFEITDVAVDDGFLSIELQSVVQGGLISGVEVISMSSSNELPTSVPSISPTTAPTAFPTVRVSSSPTASPVPTFYPTPSPTVTPGMPTSFPAAASSSTPTVDISSAPTVITSAPSAAPIESPAFEIRINAGSDVSGVDSNGNEWIKDQYYKFGWTPSNNGDIANCDPDDKFIFSSGRHTGGPGLFYDVPVPNGIYQVNLYYNEFWHSDRVFDLNVEDKVFNDLSLVNLAGGVMKAYIFEIPNVVVHDNILTIEMQSVVKGGLVSGVEIISMPSTGGLPTYAPTVSPTLAPTCSPTESPTLPPGATPAPTSSPMFEIRVNAGSNQGGVDSVGNTWIADKYFLYGWTPSTTGTVKNAPPKDQFIYQSGRHTGGPGLFYNIPVPNGVYQVNLYYNEFWHSDRVFNLNVEDKVFNNLSLVNLAGGIMTAYKYQIPNVVVNDGVITIQLQSVVKGGLVNGVEVIQVA